MGQEEKKDPVSFADAESYMGSKDIDIIGRINHAIYNFQALATNPVTNPDQLLMAVRVLKIMMRPKIRHNKSFKEKEETLVKEINTEYSEKIRRVIAGNPKELLKKQAQLEDERKTLLAHELMELYLDTLQDQGLVGEVHMFGTIE